jgi:hypothetical protein
MINVTILLKIFGFCLKPRIYQAFNNARFRFEPIFHFLNYPVVKSWNCTKKSWLDHLAIVLYFQDVSSVKTGLYDNITRESRR